MNFHYCVDPKDIVDKDKFSKMHKMFKNAGLTDLWLEGVFTNKLVAPLEQYVEARKVLIDHGYGTGIANLPIGHPGNSLNPEEGDMDLTLPSNWRYRVDRHGKKVYFCGDVESEMIQDNQNAVKKFVELGFTRFFLDDDLRMGNFGDEITGCFCDLCIDEFQQKYSIKATRDEISQEIQVVKNQIKKPKLIVHHSKLLEKWVEFQSEKIDLLIGAHYIGENPKSSKISLGIMVMHYGDERHGIDVAKILEKFPNIRMRIGEEHFGDRSFNPVRGKADEFSGMQLHMAYINPEIAHSETTVFPPRMLTPENWVLKAKYAACLGIENIFLMGGTWLITQNYWDELAKYHTEIIEIQKRVKNGGIYYPIHVAMGNYFSSFRVPTKLLLAGIPATPIKADQLTKFEKDGKLTKNELLYVPNNTILSKQWSPFLTNYQKIFLTKFAYKRNISILNEIDEDRLVFTSKFNLIPKIRHFLQELNEFPFIQKGSNIGLIWLQSTKTIQLINLDSKSNKCTIFHNGKKYSHELLGFQIKFLDF
jgi:hypothetical protein